MNVGDSFDTPGRGQSGPSPRIPYSSTEPAQNNAGVDEELDPQQHIERVYQQAEYERKMISNASKEWKNFAFQHQVAKGTAAVVRKEIDSLRRKSAENTFLLYRDMEDVAREVFVAEEECERLAQMISHVEGTCANLQYEVQQLRERRNNAEREKIACGTRLEQYIERMKSESSYVSQIVERIDRELQQTTEENALLSHKLVEQERQQKLERYAAYGVN